MASTKLLVMLLSLTFLLLTYGANVSAKDNIHSAKYSSSYQENNDIEFVDRIVRLRVVKMIDQKKTLEELKELLKGTLPKMPIFTDYGILIDGSAVPVKLGVKLALDSMNNAYYIKKYKATYSLYGEINGIILFLFKKDK